MNADVSDLHGVDDTTLVNAIPSDIQWNRMNSNPTVRVICIKKQASELSIKTYITFHCFPAKYNNKFYVGYVIKEEHSYKNDSYWRGIIKSGLVYDDISWDKSDEDLASVLNGSTRFTYTKM